MDNQEAYNIVKQHLMAQGVRSTEFGLCRYRGPNSLKCAIGVLIPDAEYNGTMESHSASLVCHLDKVDPQLLVRLQVVHDCRGEYTWQSELEQVALEFGLYC